MSRIRSIKTLIPFDSKAGGDYGFAQYVNNAEADAEGLEFVLSICTELAGKIAHVHDNRRDERSR